MQDVLIVPTFDRPRKGSNLVGKTFYYFTVVDKSTHSHWLCQCVCGVVKRIYISALLSGRRKSCGCKRAELCSNALLNGRWGGRSPKSRRGTPEWYLFAGARERAASSNLEFTITCDDIIIPTHCPLLNIPLIRGSGKPTCSSPTLDRIDNTKGYVKGNIWVISHKANTMKSNASLEEMES